MTLPVQHILLYTLLLAAAAMPAKALDRFSSATYSELNKSLFVAELWQEAGVTPADLLKGETPFEIRVTVLAKTIGSRQFRRIWLEGAAINHSAEALQSLSKPLSEFSKVIKGRLHYGDVFQVRSTQRGHTVISLDGITLMSTRNKALAPALLNGWLGEVPLSAQFKEELVQGRNDEQVIALIDRLRYSKDRQQDIQRWLEPTRIATVAKAPKVVAAVAGTPSYLSLDTTSIKPHQLAHLPPAHTGNKTDTDLTFAIRQHYYADLTHHLKKHQGTPTSVDGTVTAGEVKLWLEINRRGDVIRKKFLRTDKKSHINDDALASLERAQPFPPIPEALPDRTIRFSVPLMY